MLLLKTASRSIVETEKFDMPTKPASRNDIITKGTVEQITDETEIVNKPAKPSSDGEVISSVSAIEKTKVDEITIGKQAEQVGKVIIDKRESVTIKEEQPKEWSYSTNLSASEKTPKSVLIKAHDEDIGKDDLWARYQWTLMNLYTNKS